LDYRPESWLGVLVVGLGPRMGCEMDAGFTQPRIARLIDRDSLAQLFEMQSNLHWGKHTSPQVLVRILPFVDALRADKEQIEQVRDFADVSGQCH